MTHDEVLAVANHTINSVVNEQSLAGLRAQFRGMHLSYCQDDDVINATPYLQSPRLNIYLVDGREHCITLTGDLDAATGLLLAEVEDE